MNYESNARGLKICAGIWLSVLSACALISAIVEWAMGMKFLVGLASLAGAALVAVTGYFVLSCLADITQCQYNAARKDRQAGATPVYPAQQGLYGYNSSAAAPVTATFTSSAEAPAPAAYTSPAAAQAARFEPKQMSDGSWICSCGRSNQRYVTTCACGQNKREVFAKSAEKQ